jgi:hypothetical protein
VISLQNSVVLITMITAMTANKILIKAVVNT